jgi:hypothetical protein
MINFTYKILFPMYNTFEWLRRCDLYSVLDNKCFWHWAQLKLGVPCSRFIWSTIPWLDLYCLPQTWHTYFAEKKNKYVIPFSGLWKLFAKLLWFMTLRAIWMCIYRWQTHIEGHMDVHIPVTDPRPPKKKQPQNKS